ncbi:hypothetical protein LSUCC0031_08780 [Rhodobacterales bacterium LSUCC0031]|nr:hypothetical protein [Rhodobacterales bacterium LSUCC0031]
MAVSTDIVATWRSPARVMRKLLQMGRREDRALAILLAACLVIFIAQWPRLSREAHFAVEGQAPFEAQMAITFFAMLMIWPLMAYALAGLTHLVARMFGGRGSWYSARLALFWSLLASAPAWLLHGLVAGFLGPGPALGLVGALLLIAFLTIWIMCLIEAERAAEAEVTS